MKKVLLLSGGLDSLVMLADAVDAGDLVYGLHITYGKHARAETTLAKHQARIYRSSNGEAGVVDFKVINAQMNYLAPCPLTGDGADVLHPKRPTSWIVPGRNVVFLSLGLAWAEAEDLDAVCIGVHQGDDPFPDQSPAFIEAFQAVSFEGTEHHPRIEAPFLGMEKSVVVHHGARLKAPFEHSLSCYKPVTTEHCGECAACISRKTAFAEARDLDPTVYHSGF